MKHRLLAVAVVGATLGLGIAGGIAVASIPDSGTGVITGCYITSGANQGKLRVIDAQAGATCLGTETQLAWNAKGLHFQGAWNNTTPYKTDDLVTKSGNAYIALIANTGVPVTNTTNWALFAQKGGTGPVGPPGPAGPRGEGSIFNLLASPGDNVFLITTAFEASANGVCIVTSSVQFSPALSEALGTKIFAYRNAMSADGGTAVNDIVASHYLISNGANGMQADMSRSSTFSISAGHSYSFGVELASTVIGGETTVQLTYECA
jgi:hypothetical protein